MSDQQDIAEVRKHLEAAGLCVEHIPTAKSKRCDLRAQDASERYLIEVKGFHDDETIKDKLRNGEAHEQDVSHVYRDQVAKQLREAINQLRSTAAPPYDNALWLVTLITRSAYDRRFMSKQVIGTLYGVGAVIDCEPAGGARMRRCLYFSESIFYRHPQLDGALLLDAQGIALFLNDYGRRLERARQSGLARFLAQHGASYDMATWESRCDCLVADFGGDRKDEHAVFKRLKQKYSGRKLYLAHFHRWQTFRCWP